VPVSTSAVVRDILSAAPSLSADQVIAAARRRGVTAPDKSLRKLAHNIRSELNKVKTKPSASAAQAPKPVPVAARETPAPKPAATPSDLSSVLANVSLVNSVVLQHLELVAGIRAGG
jgi:hypothetical protein